MAQYLVTGAAGFIAHRVIEMLLEQGHQVIGVDNLNDAYDVRLKQWRLQQFEGRSGFTFLHDDICRTELYSELAAKYPKIEAVINLAARPGVRQAMEIPEVYLQTNTNGVLNLLEYIKKNNIQKLVLASTSSIYGTGAPLPTPEEADSSHPLQIYAASKKAAEVMAYTYHYLFGIDTTVFRFFTVYGPAGRPDMAMFRFTRWLAEGNPVKVTGDGEQMRGFTYLEDIARGVLMGLKPLGYEIINLGGHETVTINELLHKLETRLGVKANIEYIAKNPVDADANWANVEKARRVLNWEPLVSLDEGLDALVKWYLDNRSWASQILIP